MSETTNFRRVRFRRMTFTSSRFLCQIYSPCYSCGWESPTSILERFRTTESFKQTRSIDDLLMDKILRIDKAKEDFLFESQIWLDNILLEPRLKEISIWDPPRLPDIQALLNQISPWQHLHECFMTFSMRLRNLLTWCDHKEGHTHRLNGIDYDSLALSMLGRWSKASPSRWRRRLPMSRGDTLTTAVQFCQDAAKVVFGFETAKYERASKLSYLLSTEEKFT
jgi:hypothetical protein